MIQDNTNKRKCIWTFLTAGLGCNGRDRQVVNEYLGSFGTLDITPHMN